MTKYLIKYRYWLLGITLAFAALCAVLLFRVNINTDMTKYLPDDSQMRAGLEVMNGEFGDLTEMGGNDVRVMFNGLSDEEKLEKMAYLRGVQHVKSVMELENGSHTLYELGVAGSVDQVALGEQIEEKFPEVVAVETSQDGATAEVPMLLGGVALLLVILFAMCRSWLEPVLFLASTGIAVLINVGTNAFLPSVSVTTNSIVAILQLVLSMDYSIILLNHFRQDRQREGNSVVAMQKAVSRAAAPIVSSALTTIVGLIMLVFMKLKIGEDLGVVLSKGVFCSLICNFTVLPSLILLFEKGIDRSAKKVFVFPTDKLAHFCAKNSILLSVAFVVVFAGSYILRKQTDIIFYKSTESEIEQYFPKKNPVVLIYDNADESKMLPLVDSVMNDEGVEMVISYPSLLLREYTAPQMVESIKGLTSLMENMGMENKSTISMDMLSDDVMKVLYYAANGGNKNITMGFNEMADFIISEANNPNSVIAQQMDDEMKEKLKMLDDLRAPAAPVEQPKAVKTANKPVVHSEKLTPAPAKKQTTSPAVKTPVNQEKPAVAHTSKPGSYSPYTDTALLNKSMNYEEMASYLTMSAPQAKMVYKLAQRQGKTMTPWQFVHFMTDNILQRKGMASMIKETDRKQLLALKETMDSAMLAASTPQEAVQEQVANVSSETEEEPQVTPEDSVQPVVIPQPTPAPIVVPTPKIDKSVLVLDEMLSGKKKYTSEQMSKNLSVLGENIPKELIDLLYLYYAGTHNYDTTWTMSVEKIVGFLSDSVLTDPRFDALVQDDMRSSFAQMEQTMDEGVGKLRSKHHSLAMIITNYPTESPETYQFINHYDSLCKNNLNHQYYSVGESVMLSEMKAGFNREVLVVTLLTIMAIFLIVAITFRSVILSAILVMTVMSGVFVNVVVSGLGGSSLLYIAYLVVQSILMGAAIDYGILFANYYRTKRIAFGVEESLRETYRSSIHTILTSGLILILVPGIMAILVSDLTIANIVKSISIGALVTVLLILFVLPGVLAFCDKIIIRKRKE